MLPHAARRLVLSLALLTSFAAQDSSAQVVDLSFLQTAAEASDYLETTSYDEVLAFVGVLASVSPEISLEPFGYTHQGRRLPLVKWEGSGGAQPSSPPVRALLLANIHAGEVCGKEALLMLLRDLAIGTYREWSGKISILVAPVYNADGNEDVALDHRPLQNGPYGGIGVRHNAQGLDLNRDFVKADAPETRSLLQLIRTFDPHLFVDLHTTNGTAHGYHLTYSQPLHPSTDSAVVALTDTLLKEVSSRITRKTGEHFFYYGNLPPLTSDAERGWYTFDHRPRFSTNYVGLRNRLGILSEAYAYAAFRDRVNSSYRFVIEILDYAAGNSKAIVATTAAADEEASRQQLVATRATWARGQPVNILLGEVKEEKNPYSGERILVRQDRTRRETVTDFSRFEGTSFAAIPDYYIVPDSLTEVVDRLELHGISFFRLEQPVVTTVQSFAMDTVAVAERTYQNRSTITLSGHRSSHNFEIPAGFIVVPGHQPLSRLALILLDPESDDGVTRWGLIEGLRSGENHPVRSATGSAALNESFGPPPR